MEQNCQTFQHFVSFYFCLFYSPTNVRVVLSFLAVTSKDALNSCFLLCTGFCVDTKLPVLGGNA